MQKKFTVIIVGGGAAGIFAAIACAAHNPSCSVIVLEKTRQLLAKVRISGGGRCNVTHAAFEPKVLIQNYPRGSKELLGPFHHFGPKETVQWFEERGVVLKTEEDGRMFPVTDSSQTIINCLLAEAKKFNVDIRLEQQLLSIQNKGRYFEIVCENQPPLSADALILATGSHPQGYSFAKALGHTIVPPVPSLFTFNIPSSPLHNLAGIAFQDVKISLKNYSFILKTAVGPCEKAQDFDPESLDAGVEHSQEVKAAPASRDSGSKDCAFLPASTAVFRFMQRGPLLITHWGFSGPAVLKLSALAARELHASGYQAELIVNWLPQYTPDAIYAALLKAKKEQPQKYLENLSLFPLPQNFWKRILHLTEILPHTALSKLSHKHLHMLSNKLSMDTYKIEGKTTYKQEFVTCGGVSLKEVDFKTLQSRLCQGLYFAGEILDIDGITGGFNFQNAWTTGWIAGTATSHRK